MSSKSKSSSKSRSRSRSRSKEKVDKFGRTIKKRSRSRTRSRSHDRRRPWERSRSRSPFSRRRRSPFRRSPGRRRSPTYAGNVTSIEDPKYLNARVFIGNIPSSIISKEELEDRFKGYGTVLGVSVHDRGYGFVQFSEEEDARKAVEGEAGSLMKGSVMDVKMAAEGRRAKGGGFGRGRGGPFPRDDDRDRFGGPPGPPRSRDSSGPPRSRDGGPPPPPGRDRSPVRSDPYDDHDRYRDPYPRRSPPPGPRPPPRDDPYYPDPYRRPPPPADDPYLDRYRDDPFRAYRRDPYADPYARERDPYYRDPYEALPPKKPMGPIDCQIIMMNPQLRDYGERIEGRLRQASIICNIVAIPDDRTVPQMVEEASLKKCLFAIVINAQNEVHRSLTLNILHGTPQEHRNMPTDDAMTLVINSFETYMMAMKEKASAAALPAKPVVAPFIPPAADISYLLNLLADNRQLTVEEIDKVIGYLQERKDKILGVDSRRTSVESVRPAVAGTAGAGDTASSAYLQQEQQQLQAKILSILNGSSTATTTQPVAPMGVQAQSNPYAQTAVSVSHPGVAQPQKTSSSLINFDNPNVQKALDNLIQSGPNLLKSIPNSSPGAPAGHTSMLQRQAPTHPPTPQSQLGGYQGHYQGHERAPPSQGYMGHPRMMQ